MSSGRSHARTSRGMGPNDPRHSRGQGTGFNPPVQTGEGLETDREGRLRVRFDTWNERSDHFLNGDYEWQNPRKRNVRTVTADYTATIDDEVIKVDATLGTVTITLPRLVDYHRLQLDIKKVDSSANTVVIDPDGSETIDGATTQTLLSQYDSVRLFADEDDEWSIL